jgi:mediator of RNA polymerase II transcription subunit 16
VGCLAYINKSGDGIILRGLLCKSEDGSWTLGKEYPVPNVPGQQLVHLSWNHTGTELAIIDTSGRISIFSIFLVVNDIRPSRLCMIDPEDDKNAVVGLFWLHKEASVGKALQYELFLY